MRFEGKEVCVPLLLVNYIMIVGCINLSTCLCQILLGYGEHYSLNSSGMRDETLGFITFCLLWSTNNKSVHSGPKNLLALSRWSQFGCWCRGMLRFSSSALSHWFQLAGWCQGVFRLLWSGELGLVHCRKVWDLFCFPWICPWLGNWSPSGYLGLRKKIRKIKGFWVWFLVKEIDASFPEG